MPGENAIKVEGTVVGLMANTLFRVELSNRHCILAHVARSQRERAAGLQVGDKVSVEVSPFDFSKGRIVWQDTRNNL